MEFPSEVDKKRTNSCAIVQKNAVPGDNSLEKGNTGITGVLRAISSAEKSDMFETETFRLHDSSKVSFYMATW